LIVDVRKNHSKMQFPRASACVLSRQNIALNICRSFSGAPQTGPPGTYYNSQLGAWIRKSGVAGIRMHEASLSQGWASRGALLLPKLQSIRPTTIDLGPIFRGRSPSLQQARAAPVFAMGPIFSQAEQHRAILADASSTEITAPSSTLFTVLTADAHELDLWLAVESIAAEHKMITIEMSCRSETVSETLMGVIKLTALAHSAGIQVKLRLLDSFSGGPDGTETDPYLLQDVVQAIADGGADVLIVQGHGNEDEDDLRAHLEALLGLDVSGESMMERLGFRGNLDCTVMASKIGLTHFEAAAAGSADGTQFVTLADAATAMADAGLSLGYLDLAAAQTLSK